MFSVECARSANDHFDGQEGNDTIIGRFGDDEIVNLQVNNFIFGYPRYDVISSRINHPELHRLGGRFITGERFHCLRL